MGYQKEIEWICSYCGDKYNSAENLIAHIYENHRIELKNGPLR